MAQKAHPAVTYVEVGRGWGTMQHPVITLGLVGKVGATWHILDPNSAICGVGGVVGRKLPNSNCHTILIEGRPVCSRCRVALGHVPLSDVSGPPKKRSES
jgi:hypothetical protein